MRHHVLRWLVPLAILHGILYMLLVPPWQHYDEPGHFEYVRLVALTGRQPSYAEIDAATNREIGDSMYRFGFFPAGVRPDLIGAEPRVTGINQHLSPPLYYALAAIPVRPLQHLAIEQQLYAARSLSVLFYVLTIIVAWRIAVIVVPDEPTPQIAVPLMLLMMPTFADIMSAVNSDVLLNFAGATMFLGCVLLIRDGLRPTGLALTCLALLVALLTKRTAVGLLIPTVCALIWAFWRPPLRFWPTMLIAGGLGIGALVSAAHLSINGGQLNVALRPWLLELDRSYLRLNLVAFVASLTNVELARQIYPPLLWVVFTSFWTHLGWGHIQLGAVVEGAVLLLTIAAGCGLLIRARQLRTTLPLWQQRCIWLFFIAVIVAWLATTLRIHPVPSDPTANVYVPRGRYMFWAILPAIWLVALGIQGVLPERWRAYGPAALVGFFFILNTLAWAVALINVYY